MSSESQFDELDPRILGAIKSAIQDLRDEFDERLRPPADLSSPAEEDKASSTLAAAETVVSEPLAGTTMPIDAGADLLDICRRVEEADSQANVLAVLLEGAGAYASRAALFLLDPEGARGWGSYGFEDAGEAIEGLGFSFDERSPWKTVAGGEGVVQLNAHDCALICNQIAAPVPIGGSLIPLVLRNRVAAALYIDRQEQDPYIELPAVQILSFVATQSIETLTHRMAGSNATLRMAAVASEMDTAAGSWETVEDGAVEMIAEPVAEIPPETPAAYVEPEPEPAPPEEQEVSAVELDVPDPTPQEIEPESALPGATLVDAVTEPDVPDTTLVDAEPEPDVSEAALLDVEMEPVASDPAPVDIEPELVAPVEEPPAAAPPETPVDIEMPEPEATAPLTAEPAEEPATAPAAEIGSDGQIVPPNDLDGPGWAFTTTRIPTDLAEEEMHEEARRLARLLVSEIKLYNEEQVIEGRKNRDVYNRLKEDVDRSRQIFEERIDEEIRGKTDYFYEELVRILGDGDAATLGM